MGRLRRWHRIRLSGGGERRRLLIETTSAVAPSLAGADWVRSEEFRHEYVFDARQAGIFPLPTPDKMAVGMYMAAAPQAVPQNAAVLPQSDK